MFLTSIWAIEVAWFSAARMIIFLSAVLLSIRFHLIMTTAALSVYRQSIVDGVLLHWSHWRKVIL
jgi:hypothetical protein